MARPRNETPNFRLWLRGGVYYIRWWEDDAWKCVSTRTTIRSEASQVLAKFVAGQGTPAPPLQPTIGKILDGYLADRKPAVRAFATLEYACAALRRHLGDLEPDRLTKERSRHYVRERRREGHLAGSPSARRHKPTQDGTILRELVTLRAALRWAVKAKWIAEAPHVEGVRAPPPRDRWLTRDEAGRLVSAAGSPHVRLFLLLALHTAARAGAILELTWDRVDLGTGLIDLGPAPGGKGRAVVPANGVLLPALREARAAATCPYVVEWAGRGVVKVKTATRAAARRAELPGVTPHILRHTAATWLAQAGVPMHEIAKLLGHRNSALTERVYAKHAPEYLRRAVGVLAGGSQLG